MSAVTMRMSEGVEWALHCCVTLAWLEDEVPIPTAKLAAQFALPPAYLNKCLQALVRAGLLTSSAGQRGGFRLARLPRDISLLDVVIAVEGSDYAFRCAEIRQRGAGVGTPKSDFAKPCAIAAAMHNAEAAWRRELSRVSLANLIASAPPEAAVQSRCFFSRKD